MKNIFTIFAVFLLIFSTIVIAEEYERDGRQKDVDVIEDAEKNTDRADSDKKIQERTVQKRTLERAKVVERKKSSVMEARQKTARAKEEYSKVRENYINKKEELSRLKDKYKECTDSETEECKRTVRQVKVNAKEHLINSADLIIKNLEELKLKIQSSEDLSEEEISDLTARIDEQIKKIQEAKSTLENINEETTREDVQEAAKTIREAWSNSKHHIYNIRLRHVGNSIRNLIAKANVIGERAQEKASEINSEELNLLIAEYNSHVKSAEEHYLLAKELWEKPVVPTGNDEVAKETKTHIKDANEELKNARITLLKIMEIIKQNNKDISLEIGDGSE